MADPRRRIGRIDTSHRAPEVAMRAVTLFAASFVLAGLALAKEPTTRIEVGNGKRAIVVLTGAESAGQFMVWSGPGTSATNADGVTAPTGANDFADWAAGPVEAPQGLTVYSVRFYCAADAPGHESIPSNQCYGVRYAVAPGARGYIQIPPALDPEFPLNMRSIARGVEGSWYRASARWDEAIRPRLAAALDSAQDGNIRRTYQQQPRIYRQSSPSTRAVGATPRVTPKN
jgi:hypothetical protein